MLNLILNIYILLLYNLKYLIFNFLTFIFLFLRNFLFLNIY